MPSIITTALRTLNSDSLSRRMSDEPTYLFIGKDTSWPDEQIAPTPTGSDGEMIQAFKDIQALKRINTSSACSVIPRRDWASNTVYDQYDHRVDMVNGRKPNGARYQYYVFTDEFTVYKCISNNYGAQSTVKPTSSQLSPFQTADGYIWKYMYTVLGQDVFNYLTADWLPIYTIQVNNGSAQWQVQSNAIDGAVHNILVDAGGTGYSSANPPVITVNGDGTGAVAFANINPSTGVITGVTVTTPGQGYTHASVSLSGVGGGVGATFTCILSPPGGHGKDARDELGGDSLMLKVTLNGDESGTFPVTSFRQAGLIFKPLSVELGTKLTVPSTNGFANNDTITGTTSAATGRIRLVDANRRILWIDTVSGTFIQNETIDVDGLSPTNSIVEFVESNTNLVLTTSNVPTANLVPRSGELIYMSNRIRVTRSAAQTEEIRFVIQF